MITTELIESLLPRNARDVYSILKGSLPVLKDLLEEICEKYAVIHVPNATSAFLTIGPMNIIKLDFDFDASSDVSTSQSRIGNVYDLRLDPDHEAYFDMARIIIKCYGAGYGFLPFPKEQYSRYGKTFQFLVFAL